ncbi:hypothetical protein G6F42_019517 [Rhizopus arrhizus]|nr:hypothetical protein G6F42_019517 [Rhizopus arrhizus]
MAQPNPQVNYTSRQISHFQQYHSSREQRLTFPCATCSRYLLERDTCWRPVDKDAMANIPCRKWGLRPIFQSCQSYSLFRYHKQLAVCRYHQSGVLNYRERSCLSNIKITRKINNQQSYCGHYEPSGIVWAEYNLENTVMNYGDTLGIMNNISTAKIKLIHDKLRMQNSLLKTPFDSSDLHHSM